MDYKKLYDSIILNAKSLKRDWKNKSTYTERHHIVPKCCGGDGLISQWRTHPNIVVLTAKEHFLCHRLLVEIYRGTPYYSKVLYSFFAMIHQKGTYQKRDYNVGSREYERVRLEYSEILKRSKQGVFLTQEHKLKISKSLTGKKRTEEQKKNYGKRKNKRHTLDTIEKLKKIKKGKPNYKKRTGHVVQIDKETGKEIKIWECPSAVSKTLNLDLGSILNCCKGKCKTVGGFNWKYKI